MGNQASSGERRNKPGDPYPVAPRMDGQVFHIDQHKTQKEMVPQILEDDQIPVFGKVLKSPNEEKDDSVASMSRTVLNTTNKKMLPWVIKWNGGGKDVAVAGSFNSWQALPMVKSEKDFVIIVDLPEGNHEYKFFVDGEWKVNPSEKSCSNPMGTENNVITVKESDFEELENALLKDPNDKTESPYSMGSVGVHKIDETGEVITNAPRCATLPQSINVKDIPSYFQFPEHVSLTSDKEEEYNQEIPEGLQNEKRKGPPILPPHLLQVILNKDTPVSCEPTLLPEPNHVMLNHMYALSIRDGMMVLSTSHRFRKKCVTTLIYRPI